MTLYFVLFKAWWMLVVSVNAFSCVTFSTSQESNRTASCDQAFSFVLVLPIHSLLHFSIFSLATLHAIPLLFPE